MTVFILDNQYYQHWCDGCNELHLIPNFNEKIRWTFNDDFDRPTLTPSVRHTWENKCCHYYITNGQINYCGDCTHTLAGKSMPLSPLPDNMHE